MVARDLEEIFPHLKESGYERTSPKTREYNCIAWAAEDSGAWWWPAEVSFWPEGVPREESLEAFQQAFEAIGYQTCENAELEEGFQKVAIYTSRGVPKHAARQLPDGGWTSKLGGLEDIRHETLGAVAGTDYGSPALILRRPKNST